jgi:hypothetical protein
MMTGQFGSALRTEATEAMSAGIWRTMVEGSGLRVQGLEDS